MNIAQIKEFKSDVLFDNYTKTWCKQIRAEKYVKNLNKTVNIPHILYCKDRKELEQFEVGDDIVLADGFYFNGEFVYADMIYRPSFGE